MKMIHVHEWGFLFSDLIARIAISQPLCTRMTQLGSSLLQNISPTVMGHLAQLWKMTETAHGSIEPHGPICQAVGCPKWMKLKTKRNLLMATDI